MGAAALVRAISSILHQMGKEDYEKHFVAQIAQKALIEQEGKVLMVKYPEVDWAQGKWDLPGGRLHEGEESLVGARREVKEETGVDIEVTGILATGVKVVSDSFKLFWVIYRATPLNPRAPVLPEEGEIERVEWRPKEDLFTLPLINPDYAEALKPILV